ncbi:hypothetical protein [Paenibacillus sp. 1P07SE]|uniref:hypothetical protein n=1 Tax=Paenibacillus sp. 1P07SE TaxID=3132209 RepID=UPI0039A60368
MLNLLAAKASIRSKLFLAGLVLSIIPIVIMAGMTLIIAKKSISDELEKTNRNTMRQMQERVESTLDQVDRMVVQGAYSQALHILLYEDGLRGEGQRLEDAHMMLSALEQLIDHAEDVFLYAPVSERVIASSGVYNDARERLEPELLQALEETESSLLWLEMTDRDHEQPSGHASSRLTGMTLVRTIPIGSETPHGYLIVRLGAEMFSVIFDQMRLGRTGGTVLLTPSGHWYAEPAVEALLSARDSGWQNRLVQPAGSRAPDAASILTGKDNKLSVHAMQAPANGWTYISIVPYKEIMGHWQVIERVMWGATALLILIMPILALFMSNAIHQRVRSVLGRMRGREAGAAEGRDELDQIVLYVESVHDRNDTLEERVKSSYPALETHYVRSWLTEPLTPALQAELARLDVVRADTGYIAICIDWIVQDVGGRNRDTLQLEDLLTTLKGVDAAPARCFLVKLERDRIGGLLATTSGEDGPAKAQIQYILERWIEEVRQGLGQDVVIGVGRSVSGADNVHSSFLDSLEALRQRLPGGGNRIYWIDEVKACAAGFHYPVQQEQAVIAQLKLGDLPRACQALEDFKTVLSEEGSLTHERMLQYYSVLITSLMRLPGPGAGSGDDNVFGANLLEKLSRFREIDQVHHWLMEEVLGAVSKLLASERSQETTEAARSIRRAMQYIQEHADMEVSLPAVAEYTGLPEFSSVCSSSRRPVYPSPTMSLPTE